MSGCYACPSSQMYPSASSSSSYPVLVGGACALDVVVLGVTRNGLLAHARSGWLSGMNGLVAWGGGVRGDDASCAVLKGACTFKPCCWLNLIDVERAGAVAGPEAMPASPPPLCAVRARAIRDPYLYSPADVAKDVAGSGPKSWQAAGSAGALSTEGATNGAAVSEPKAANGLESSAGGDACGGAGGGGGSFSPAKGGCSSGGGGPGGGGWSFGPAKEGGGPGGGGWSLGVAKEGGGPDGGGGSLGPAKGTDGGSSGASMGPTASLAAWSAICGGGGGGGGGGGRSARLSSLSSRAEADGAALLDIGSSPALPSAMAATSASSTAACGMVFAGGPLACRTSASASVSACATISGPARVGWCTRARV